MGVLEGKRFTMSLLASLAGLIICLRGIERNRPLYRYGAWFFGLTSVSFAWSYFSHAMMPLFLEMFRQLVVPMARMGWLVVAISWPGRAVAFAALVLLAAGFYLELKAEEGQEANAAGESGHPDQEAL